MKIKKIKGKSKLPFHDEQIKEILKVVAAEDSQLRDAIIFSTTSILDLLKLDY